MRRLASTIYHQRPRTKVSAKVSFEDGTVSPDALLDDDYLDCVIASGDITLVCATITFFGPLCHPKSRGARTRRPGRRGGVTRPASPYLGGDVSASCARGVVLRATRCAFCPRLGRDCALSD